MAHIQSLQAAIDRFDPEGFLVDYLTLVTRKASLTLPKSLVKETLLIEWRDCIPSRCGNVTDPFIEKLTDVWIQVVREQGTKLGDTFAEECYNILINRAATAKDHPNDTRESDTPVNDLTEVVSSISDHYQNEKKARKKKPKRSIELVEQAKEACKIHQVEPFLEAILVLAGRTDKALFPATSIPNKIYAKWETVIAAIFKMKADEEFLESLSGIWLNLVTKHGIPTRKSQIKTILIAVRTQQLSAPKVQKKKQNQRFLSC